MKMECYSPVIGVQKELSQVNDVLFSQEKFGPTIAAVSLNGKVYAPCDGIVESVFDTKHAIGIRTQDDTELLIHIGIDTVELNGKGFKVFVSEGMRIQHGQIIAEFNQKLLKKCGYDDTVFMILSHIKETGQVIKNKADRFEKCDVVMTIEY